MKLSQRIAIYTSCSSVGSATHSIFAQMATGGLCGTANDAIGTVVAKSAITPISAVIELVPAGRINGSRAYSIWSPKADRVAIEAPGSAAQPVGPSPLTAEPNAGIAPQQSLNSSTSQVHLWSIRHDLAQNLHSLRSSAGQDAVPEDPLQVLAPTTK